jgi:hypothetical protein
MKRRRNASEGSIDANCNLKVVPAPVPISEPQLKFTVYVPDMATITLLATQNTRRVRWHSHIVVEKPSKLYPIHNVGSSAPSARRNQLQSQENCHQ